MYCYLLIPPDWLRGSPGATDGEELGGYADAPVAAFSVSESQAPRVRTYIQRQEQHHRRIDFQQEVRNRLRRHNIEFDERYLWDYSLPSPRRGGSECVAAVGS